MSQSKIPVAAASNVSTVLTTEDEKKASTWISPFDMKGGKIIAEGKPEDICKIKDSYTGQFLKPLLV